MMKRICLTTLNVDERVKEAISESMVVYCNKLARGNICVGLEATFQHELALILKDVLGLKTLTKDERFSLTLEQNIPVAHRDNYVDIVVHYDEGGNRRDYLIELKFKKISDSAPDLGTIETYFDLYNLDRLHNTTCNPGNICGSFVIFLTNLQTYKNKPRKAGTRFELPMFDGASILAGQTYMASGSMAKSTIYKHYGDNFPGFVFTKNLAIEYNHFLVGQADYWYFIQEI